MKELAKQAGRPAVIARALQIGGWNADELDARAWYTGTGPDSHIENTAVKALQHAVLKGVLTQIHTVYAIAGSP